MDFYKTIGNLLAKFGSKKSDPPFGLDISAGSIKALALERRAEGWQVRAFSMVRLPQGVINRGALEKKEEFRQALSRLLLELKDKTPSKRVVMNIPEAQVFTKVLATAQTAFGRALQEAVKKEAQGYIPYNIERLYYDFQIIQDAQGGKKEVLFVACPKVVLNGYLEVLRSAELEVAAVDTDLASIVRALSLELPASESVFIINIGAVNTILSLFDRQGIRFSNVLALAGNALSRALMEKLRVSAQEAEVLKSVYGMKAEGAVKASRILRASFRPIVEEVKKEIAFYRSRTAGKITKVYLQGGSSAVPGLREFLASELGLEIISADPLSGNKITLPADSPYEGLFARQPFSMTSVIGLALRSQTKNPAEAGVNLLHKNS